MLRLSKKDVTPPGGWHYREPDGTFFKAGTFGDLLRVVTEDRVAKMLPVENIASEVEEWICRETNAKCKVVAPASIQGPVEIEAGDAWRFMKTAAAWIKKRGVVSQEEADRRAEICAGCRYQGEPPVNCWGCSQLFALIHEAIGERRTRFDEQLRFCSVCKCNNKIQAWTPLDVLRAYGPSEPFRGLDTDGRGTPCWKAPDAP